MWFNFTNYEDTTAYCINIDRKPRALSHHHNQKDDSDNISIKYDNVKQWYCFEFCLTVQEDRYC